MADLAMAIMLLSIIGVLITLIMIVISIIKKDFKFKTKHMLIICGGFIVVFIISFFTFGVSYNPTNTASTVTNKNTVSTQKEDEAKKKADESKAKYVALLESGKTYEAMTTQERTDASELLQNWEKQDQEFKDKYNTQKEFIETSKNEAVAKWKAEEDAKAAQAAAQKAEEEKVAYDTGITYNQLARTPNDYKGKKAKFTGKVIQVMEGDKENDLRIAVNGNYDTILFVGYDPKITNIRILENDNITVKGTSIGIYSYQSTIGGKISIPGMWVDNIELNQ